MGAWKPVQEHIAVDDSRMLTVKTKVRGGKAGGEKLRWPEGQDSMLGRRGARKEKRRLRDSRSLETGGHSARAVLGYREDLAAAKRRTKETGRSQSRGVQWSTCRWRV